MPNISFTSLLLVTIVAFLAPLILGLLPIRGLPDVVLEIVIGIVIGPSVLGWARIDLPIQVLSLLGLAFLLFLSGRKHQAGHGILALVGTSCQMRRYPEFLRQGVSPQHIYLWTGENPS